MEEQKSCVCKDMNICLGDLCWYITAYGLFHHGFMYTRQASCSQLEALKTERRGWPSMCGYLGICDQNNRNWHTDTVTFVSKEERSRLLVNNLIFTITRGTRTANSNTESGEYCISSGHAKWKLYVRGYLEPWPKQTAWILGKTRIHYWSC